MPPERDALDGGAAGAGDPMAWLFARQRFGLRPGLERTRALLAALGDPQERFAGVLVGGTNGKGSTVATIDAIARADGRRSGRFVSPDLGEVTERIAVDGVPIARSALEATVTELRPVAERVGATFFELLFATACRHFASTGVELATIEVGLGGRYDATNTLPALRSVVTGVALDHTAILGDSVRAIALDKADILRPERPAFTGARGEALATLDAEARRRGTPLEALGRELTLERIETGWRGSTFVLERRGVRLPLDTPLLGRHQVANAALAASVALSLGVRPERVAAGVAATLWPGRLERLRWGDVPLLLDGAHNPDAAAALAATLRELGAPTLTLVLGVSADKDVEGIASALAPLARRVIATRALRSGRALDPEALAARVGTPHIAPDPEAALQLAAALEPGATVLVAGSLFLVGEARALALGRPLGGPLRWQ